MTLSRKRKKVKQKERILREKRQLRSASKKAAKKKKKTQKQRRKKPQLVVNTNAEIRRLKKELAAQKKKVAALRKRTKSERKKARVKKKAEPGTLLSPRAEAARRGWTTRRAKQAKMLAEFLHAKQSLPEAEQLELEKITKRGMTNRKQILDLYVKKLPDYLIRQDKEEFLVERKENLIMHRLIIARGIVGNFDEEAYSLAEEYDLEPYEIYSLWHGYELEE